MTQCDMLNRHSCRWNLDAFTWDGIIEKLEDVRRVTRVAKEYGISYRIVSRLWRKFQKTRTAAREFSRSFPQATMAADNGVLSYRQQGTDARQQGKSQHKCNGLLDARYRLLPWSGNSDSDSDLTKQGGGLIKVITWTTISNTSAINTWTSETSVSALPEKISRVVAEFLGMSAALVCQVILELYTYGECKE